MMSYPRPPMGMPPMGPGGMMPRYPGYPPMGMMPMGMRMMPMMHSGMQHSNHNNSAPMSRPKKQLVPQEIPKKTVNDDKPPVTTVFVGNISERAPDAMVRQQLQRCGNVLSWKRVQGASGKLQAFGFCEYEDPEATLRCIRLLNEWRIADKELVVKVDAKTKSLLDDYKRKKRQKANGGKKKESVKEVEDDGKDSDKEQGEIVDEDRPSDDEDDLDDELDEFCQREDRVATAGLEAIMREYAHDLAKVPPPEMTIEQKREKRREKKEKEKIEKEPGLEELELGEEELSLINREIKSFRDAHKDDDPREKEREKDREREARRDRERDWERDREREREREMKERDQRRDRDRERERERRDYSRRSRSKSRERTRERDRERERSIDVDAEDEEEVYERRKHDRKIREKEGAYQELLKKWEARERKKFREYEKEKEREDERKMEESREARRLKEFLEDYDDERDDLKYYKSSALQRRLKEREKEMEADERDRQREKEELEEIRKKLEDEGHPDIEGEMARIEKERDEHLMPRLQLSDDDGDDSDVMETEDPDKENNGYSSQPAKDDSRSSDQDSRSNEPDVVEMDPQVVEQETRAREREAWVSEREQRGHDLKRGHDLQRGQDLKRGQDLLRGHGDDAEEEWVNEHESRHELREYDKQKKQNDSQNYDRRRQESRNYDNREQQGPLRPIDGNSMSSRSSPDSDGGGIMMPDPHSEEESQESVPHSYNSTSRSADTLSKEDRYERRANFRGLNIEEASQSPEPQPQKRRKLTVGDVFNQDEEEGAMTKKTRLVPLDYSEEEKAAITSTSKPTTAEEKRKCIKNLIERIPTGKEELFDYGLDWKQVDQLLMDKRIKPWVNKKIVEYIGEEEPTLTEFICSKVMAHSSPHNILGDVAMVLDEEAEVFVVKMWRLLIYETEAKKMGLVK